MIKSAVLFGLISCVVGVREVLIGGRPQYRPQSQIAPQSQFRPQSSVTPQTQFRPPTQFRPQSQVAPPTQFRPQSSVTPQSAFRPPTQFRPQSQVAPPSQFRPAGQVGAQGQEQAAHILRQAQDIQADGYKYSYATSNGIDAEEQGQLVNQGGEEPSIAAQGGFSYTSPEGQQIAVSYIADANGFQPQGEHLPTPPPVPPAILRALKYLAEHPSEEDED